ncbi:MAG: response regulator [Candidatus Scalindua rubra]|uniref:Two-component response regulator n=1 Tax=Candidatus Scalindua brodae TaxID=237368 RepID=A0A0B0EI89_9BACT|nr:MAG: two-component response regulator [Candidatus Scalindua brodae]MBZ0109521.1 response regulator [Candidatus Scalindua rubra]TWU33467.1 Polar-differentiation response regulator DivK [Candidatus Brocadiaceae bacterium S225]
MRKTVMIVDDEQYFHDLYAKMLRGSSYDMINVYDGYEALSRLNEKRPDLIITDITLNMMTGDTLFLHLKSMPEYKDIPFILTTDISLRPYKSLREIDPNLVFLDKTSITEALMEEVKAKIG